MMASSFFFFFFFFFFSIILLILQLGASLSTDRCRTPSCNSTMTSLSVKFPFRLPEFQPDTRCQYSPNFTLSCSPRNETLLHLPNSGTFAVYSINYWSQIVTLTDPDRCLPQRFLNFDLSNSPFSMYSSYSENFTYYNCTSTLAQTMYPYYKVSCMSSDNYTVILWPFSYFSASSQLNCTVIKSVFAPYAISYKDNNGYVMLNWSEPYCSQCEYSARGCGFKGNTTLIECQEITKESKSKSSLVLGSVVTGLIILMIVSAYMFRIRRNIEHPPQSNRQEPALIQTQLHTITTNLSEHAIDSSMNPVFILGEGDVLLEPNISPCAICLSEYKSGDMLRTLQDCNHYFHSECVDEWLKMKGTCPVCRKGA